MERTSSKNGPLTKRVVKMMGFLLGRVLLDNANEESYLLYISIYHEIIIKYSFSAQKDFLRISVIKSLEFSMVRLMDCLKKGGLFKLFLKISHTFIRLLQDEIPEIRQKIANFISKLNWKSEENPSKQSFDVLLNQKLNFNVVLRKLFKLIVHTFCSNPEIHNHPGNDGEMIAFLFYYIFDSEFFNYKKVNHEEKKIFQTDKPNKFHEDYLLKRIAFKGLQHLWGEALKSKAFKLNCGTHFSQLDTREFQVFIIKLEFF